MTRTLAATAIAALPFAANAADLSTDYSFIQDNAPPAVWSAVGHLELSLGWFNIQVPSAGQEQDLYRFEGRGRANVPLAGNWNLELETGGVALFNNGDSTSFIGTYGHLWGAWGGFRVGPFGGIDFYDGAYLGTGGLEAEADVGNLTLGIQGNYTWQIDCENPDCYYWGIVGWADFYLGPNTRLGVEGRYADFSTPGGPGSSTEVWSVWGTAEHRVAGTPISVFLRGGYEDSFDFFESFTVAGGIRAFLDGGLTLQEHDRQVPFAFRQPEIIMSIIEN